MKLTRVLDRKKTKEEIKLKTTNEHFMYSDYIPAASKENKDRIDAQDNPSDKIISGQDLLRYTRVGNILHSKKFIITAPATAKISGIFTEIIKHDITSVPIYDSSSKKYLAFVDIIDIACYILNHTTLADVSEINVDVLKHATDVPCSRIANLSERNPFTPIGSEASLDIAIELILKYSVHRLAVLDSDGTLVTVLTQSQIINFLSEHLDKFPKLCQTKVGDIQLGYTSDLWVATLDQKTSETIELMRSKKISGVPIVDEDKKIVGAFSLSDLKALGSDFSNINLLVKEVKDFPKRQSTRRNTPVFVLPSSTIEELVHKIIDTKVHRVFVTEINGKPIGVIVLSTLLKLFLEHPE